MSSVAQAVTTVVGGVIGFAVGGPKGAYFGASLGYRIGDQDDKEKGPSKTYSLGKFGMTRSHRLPVPVVYGEHLVSGNVIYEDIYGGENDDQNLDICLAVSEGPVESITQIQADEIQLGTEFYELKLGKRSQTPVSFNNDNFPYTAYIGVKLDAEELELNGSPTISALVKGRKIDTYNGTSWTNQYSNNPAWVVYDFLTNSRYGMGFDAEDIDENSFLSVAEWADTNNYTLNIVLDSQQSTLDILQSMLQSFNSFLIYTGGQISLRADTVEDEVVQSFDQDTNIILDSFSYSQASKREIPNKISVEYVDPAENWEMVEAYYSNDQDIEERGEVINQNVTLYGVTNFDQAGRVARTLFNKQYYNRNLCQFETTIKAIECEPGDVIAITHDLPGWVNKEFRVLEVREKEDDTMLLVCKEYNASVYTDEGVVYQQPTGPTLPNPWERPAQITAPFTLSERRYQVKDGHHYSTVLVEWSKPNDPFYKYANIYVREVGGQWSSTPNGKVEGSSFETEALDEGDYEILLLSENRHGIKATFGDAPSQTITVEGKTTAPADVSVKTSRFINTITIEWFNISDNDLDAYELRTNQSFGSDDNNLIYRGDNNQVTLDSFPLPTFAAGTRSYTFYLKALNNSGLYSVNATIVTVTNAEPNPPTLNITEFFESLWIELEPPAGDPSINGFEIEVTPTGGTAEVFNVSAGERLTYSAEAATSYEIRARSYDIIGSGAWSIVYNASTKDIDSITQFASALRPATIVETLPILPSDSYPPESYVTLIEKTNGEITNVELYRNDNDSWAILEGPDLENGMATYPRVVAGTIQAGAISTTELDAEAVTADKIGTGELEAYMATIGEAFIESGYIIDLDADKVTVGGSSTNLSGIVNDDFQSQYNTLYQRYLGLKESNYLPEPTYTWSATLDLGLSWTDNNVTSEQWSAIKLIDLWQVYDAEFSNLQTKLANKTTQQADYDNYYTAMENLIDYMQYLENEMSRTAENNVYDNIGDMAYEDAVELAKLGSTIVEGGYLQTILINADRIDTGTLSADNVTVSSGDGTTFNLQGNDLTIDTKQFSLDSAGNADFSGTITGQIVNADNINVSQLSSISADIGTITAGSLDAGVINTGTLDASTISVTNLSADSITTGILNTDRIGSNTLDAIKLKLDSWYSVEETPNNILFIKTEKINTNNQQSSPMKYFDYNYTTQAHETKIRLKATIAGDYAGETTYVIFTVGGNSQTYSASGENAQTVEHIFNVSSNSNYDISVEAYTPGSQLVIQSGMVLGQIKSVNQT